MTHNFETIFLKNEKYRTIKCRNVNFTKCMCFKITSRIDKPRINETSKRSFPEMKKILKWFCSRCNVIEEYLTLFVYRIGHHWVFFKSYNFQENVFQHIDTLSFRKKVFREFFVWRKLRFEIYRFDKLAFRNFPSAKKKSFHDIYIPTTDFSPNHTMEMIRFVACHFVERSFGTF